MPTSLHGPTPSPPPPSSSQGGSPPAFTPPSIAGEGTTSAVSSPNNPLHRSSGPAFYEPQVGGSNAPPALPPSSASSLPFSSSAYDSPPSQTYPPSFGPYTGYQPPQPHPWPYSSSNGSWAGNSGAGGAGGGPAGARAASSRTEDHQPSGLGGGYSSYATAGSDYSSHKQAPSTSVAPGSLLESPLSTPATARPDASNDLYPTAPRLREGEAALGGGLTGAGSPGPSSRPPLGISRSAMGGERLNTNPSEPHSGPIRHVAASTQQRRDGRYQYSTASPPPYAYHDSRALTGSPHAVSQPPSYVSATTTASSQPTIRPLESPRHIHPPPAASAQSTYYAPPSHAQGQPTTIHQYHLPPANGIPPQLPYPHGIPPPGSYYPAGYGYGPAGYPPHGMHYYHDPSRPPVIGPYGLAEELIGQPRRLAVACFFCRRRKIRCDGDNPCRHCARRGLDCEYPSEPRKRGPMRGPNKPSGPGSAGAGAGSSVKLAGSSGATAPGTGPDPVLKAP